MLHASRGVVEQFNVVCIQPEQHQFVTVVAIEPVVGEFSVVEQSDEQLQQHVKCFVAELVVAVVAKSVIGIVPIKSEQPVVAKHRIS